MTILKGEKSFPVFITTFTVVNKETREKIKYDDYRLMSEERRKEYNVYPKLQVYNVFNVAQTNLQEARPELYKKLEAAAGVNRPLDQGDNFSFPAMDKMIKENGWICPIKPVYGDNAYYSISKNEIVIPEKRQFKDGESFYTNLGHEMAHSTGSENHLGRLKPASFGSAEYAREELVAELSAALVAQRFGMTKHLKEDSASYLKNWLDSLKESPEFIKTTLTDVKKASHMINQHIDAMQLKIDQEQKRQSRSRRKLQRCITHQLRIFRPPMQQTVLTSSKMTVTTMHSSLRQRNTTRVMLLISPESIYHRPNIVVMTSLLRMSIMLWYIIRLLEAHTM